MPRLLSIGSNRVGTGRRVRDSRERKRLTLAFLCAIDRMQFSGKQWAALLRVHPSQWNRMRTAQGGHHLHVQRFDEMPEPDTDRFLELLLEELARQLGRVVVTPAGSQSHIAAAMRELAAALEQPASPARAEVR